MLVVVQCATPRHVANSVITLVFPLSALCRLPDGTCMLPPAVRTLHHL